MRALSNFMCEYAAVHGDKLNLVGIFTDIQAPAFPSFVERAYFAAVLMITKEEAGSHCVDIGVFDDASTKVVGTELTMNFPWKDHATSQRPFGTIHLIACFKNLKFAREGLHVVELRVDSVLTGSSWLWVRAKANGETSIVS